MKLMLAQLFVNKSYREFHENLTDSLITDTRLQADGHVWSARTMVQSSEGLNIGATVIISPFCPC
jgi:hypothetical protein